MLLIALDRYWKSLCLAKTLPPETRRDSNIYNSGDKINYPLYSSVNEWDTHKI